MRVLVSGLVEAVGCAPITAFHVVIFVIVVREGACGTYVGVRNALSYESMHLGPADLDLALQGVYLGFSHVLLGHQLEIESQMGFGFSKMIY